MYCLAGVGGGVEGILETTKQAHKILAIDGCPVDCVKNTLEKAGFTEYVHCRVTDMGFEKGSTAVTDETVGKIAEEASSKISCC